MRVVPAYEALAAAPPVLAEMETEANGEVVKCKRCRMSFIWNPRIVPGDSARWWLCPPCRSRLPGGDPSESSRSGGGSERADRHVMSGTAQRSNQRGDRLSIHRRPQVVVAHGEGGIREGLAGILRRAAYDVDEVSNLDEALAVLCKSEIRALVVSVRLPPEGCLPLLSACDGSPPIVLLGGPDDDMAGLTEDERVQSGLTRPFPVQALYDAVAEATSRPQHILGGGTSPEASDTINSDERTQ